MRYYFFFFLGFVVQTFWAQVGIGTTTPDATVKLDVRGPVKIMDGTEGDEKILVSDAVGKASWENVNDGVRTKIIHEINVGTTNTVVLWTHPEGIEVRFDASSETVMVENKTTDTSDNWNVVIYGSATDYNTVSNATYKNRNIVDGTSNDTLTFDIGDETGGWFTIYAADQSDEKDGFIMQIVYNSDDFNGTVQYWDQP